MRHFLPLALALVLSTSALAQQAAGPAGDAHESAAPHGASELAEGEVRRVDRERQRITIRHGVIPRLDMPPMTMVFHVQDPTMLDQVQPGQKVRFDAEKKGSTYTVTRLEVAQ